MAPTNSEGGLVAWKTRGGRPYYYRSVREGGRVRSAFLGSGPEAEEAARADRLGAAARDEARGAWRAERAALEADDRGQADVFDRVERVARLALESAGFRRHNRGEWRRCRMGQLTMVPDVAGPPATRAEIEELLGRASRGDASAMPRVREAFRADPAGMIRECHGDLACLAETTTIRGMAGGSLRHQHAIGEKMAWLRSELAGPEAPALERLLAERAALCWLDVHGCEIRHDLATGRPGGLTHSQSDHYSRMRDRSHRRYLQALKTLASVRKMGPAIQINLARNQVNISSRDDVTDGRDRRPPA